MYFDDPSHDASSLFIGPVDSGVISDRNTNRAGGIHPPDPPWARQAKQAVFFLGYLNQGYCFVKGDN